MAGAVGFALGLAFALEGVLHQGLAGAAPGAVLMAASGAARGALGVAAAAAGSNSAARIKATVRDGLVRRALGGRAGARPILGDSMAQVVEGVEALDGYYSRFSPLSASSSPAVLGGLACLALGSLPAAGIVAATFIPFVGAMILTGSLAADQQRAQAQALVRLSGRFSQSVQSLPIILAFQGEERATNALAGASSNLAAATLSVLRLAFLSSAALEFFASTSVGLVAVYCGFNLLNLISFRTFETLSLGRAVYVLALTPEIYLPLRRLAAAYHDRQAAEAAAETLIEEAQAPREARSALPAAGVAAPDIRFEAVTLTYPGADAPVLAQFNLVIAPGETVALMGPTGSGKTTVLSLVLGLASPNCGSVRLGGVGPGLAGRPDVAWASQSPAVTPGALGENIALSRRDAPPQAIARAAAQAGLDASLQALARRLDERGGGLSGGEMRRLALARALLRDAPILLLDEPTAHLDEASEAALLPALREAAKGRTTLIATHSKAVAALADRTVHLA
jgi:ATP-binding cassette subfamily C protein CydD